VIFVRSTHNSQLKQQGLFLWAYHRGCLIIKNVYDWVQVI